MTYPVLPPRLYLVVPWDLPTQQPLNEVDKAQLEYSLKQFLIALEQESHQVATTIIHQALLNLDISSVVPVQLTSTQTVLKPREIEDFDTYFEISHVQTQTPAVCMVWSLLVSYQAFLALLEQGDNFNPEHGEVQRQGFKSYVYLLARVFNLDLN